MRAMVAAAEEVNAPVIIQASAKTINYYSHEAIYSWIQDVAGDSPVPVGTDQRGSRAGARQIADRDLGRGVKVGHQFPALAWSCLT